MQPHGDITLKWQDNVLVLSTQGPFNLEGAKQCFSQLQQFVEQSNNRKWRRVDIIDDEAFGEPAVMKIFSQTYSWAFEHGCIALALVYSNIIQKSMCVKFMQASDYNIQVFKTEVEAVNWLAAQ